ncbi:MAG TPA: folylpolyglutamate synthase/dihydrofolate synthase family protein [Thermoanaerobaculia bacterium]|nr:folylpolyglutamate synthase/dihydrofolate synthase family protein [Thermoanaerobaculia bacterium]
MSLSPDAILARLEGLGIRLGLENTGRLLAALGSPQLRYPTVLIAGSNGKGSTSALLAGMATAAGYRTGLYTSPHLETVEERLRINGRAVPPEVLSGLLEKILAVSERELGGLPTYFEAMTVAAFLWFAESGIDLGVIEVGLGGRLDATNLCDPVLSLITSISLEHTETLGDTLAAIAREKAGILRPGRPALTWVEEPEALDAIRAVADGLGARLTSAPRRVIVESAESLGWEGQRVCLATPLHRHDLRLALLGRHQIRNLGLAVLAAETLEGMGFERLDAQAIAAGVEDCRWPGRLEAVDLPDGRCAVLDAAHNPEGAAALADFLARMGASYDLLFGVLADKDAAAMLRPLAPRARRIVLTTPASPRARAPEELPALLPSLPPGRERQILVEPHPGRALDRALEGGPGGASPTLVICGSIYLIGEIRRGLRERLGVPPPAGLTVPADLRD